MIAEPGATSRLTCWRLASTSPARLAAASSPVNAITAIGSANARSRRVGRGPQVDALGQVVGVKHQRQPEHDDQRLQDQVGDRDHDRRAQTAGADAGEVVDRHERDHRERHDDLERAVADRRPERGRGSRTVSAVTAIRIV